MGCFVMAWGVVGILKTACSYGFENILMFFKKILRVQYNGDGGKMTELKFWNFSIWEH